MSTKLYPLDANTFGAVTGSDAMHDLDTSPGASKTAYVKNTAAGAVTPPTTATQWTKTGGGTVCTWASRKLVGVTISGAQTFNLWAFESAAQANATITAELYRLNSTGAIVSTIAAATLARTECGTSPAANNWAPTVTSRTLVDGDRLGVRIFMDDGNGVTMASGRTITCDINGPTGAADGDSWIQITEALQFYAAATASITLGALSLTATGTVDVQGTASNTLGALTLASTGTVEIQGAASTTLGALSLTATGTVQDSEIQGTASVAIGALTLTGTGTVDVQGASSLALGSLALTATGTVDVLGSSSLTLGALTLTAAGAVEVQGASSFTLGALSLAATGTVAIQGAASLTLDPLMLTSSGTVDVTGQAALTMGALALTGMGTVDVVGSANLQLDPLTMTSMGAVEVQGQDTSILGSLGLTASGTVEVQGSADLTLDMLELVASGIVGDANQGTAALVLDAIAISAVGSVEVQGAADLSLGGVVLSATGTVQTVASPPGALTLLSFLANTIDVDVFSAGMLDVSVRLSSSLDLTILLERKEVTMAQFIVGQQPRFLGTFRNDSQAKDDPSAVYFQCKLPDDSEITYQYGVDAELVRLARGVYYVDLPITAAGHWTWSMWSTGTVVDKKDGMFSARAARA